ncbi:pyrroloquinoline quinone-dependent dehydrogenase [Sinimarinibacterium flocculans]|uniref:pyrroloquinoline quinone-dependent dehydrogenase n=1 Tax=Sinimarinibacterium flocculans TaxID=985250 RepID=UPI00248FDE47|nr:pyrroloquinoline quinone-dependent dehydrogenase [Sinimarinibacterium flocculans]
MRRILIALTALAVLGVLGWAGWLWSDGRTRTLPYASETAAIAPPDTGWPQYGNDAGGVRYSPLDQINRGNLDRLEVAWTWQAGELDRIKSGQQPFNPWQATPVLVGGNLIGCTPTGRVFALDPATGTQRWDFDPKAHLSPLGHAFVKCRGVSSYEDESRPPEASCRTRVIWGTGEMRVYALDARTGARCADFGAAEGTPGEIRFEVEDELSFPNELQIHAPPAIANGVAVFGSTMADMLRIDAPSGKVRAVDVLTGARLWSFDPVPRDDADPAAATWGENSNRNVGGGNVWSLLSADPANGLIFIPTSSPSVDIYGGYRPGENRYTDSLVALDARSGRVVWHFQFVHHDLWDYDLASQPILVDLPDPHGGPAKIPAVVQLTKQGMVFAFDRLSGEALWPIEERPVPRGDMPGEWYSPTQPFSTLPALVQQGLKPDDAWGFTFLDRRECRGKIEKLRNDGLFTPPSLQGTIYMPAAAGGANWGGGAIDPESGTLIVNTLHMAAIMRLIPRETVDLSQPGSVATGLTFPQAGTPYVSQLSFLTSSLGAPCVPPPWGRLTALDLVSGEIKWQVPLGSIEGLSVASIKAFKAKLGDGILGWLGKLIPEIPLPLEWGTPHAGGPIITRGGIAFIAATADDKIRAFDLHTGRKLWQSKLPAGGQATPMTYAVGGRQYVVVMAGGHPYYDTTQGDYLVAYALKP